MSARRPGALWLAIVAVGLVVLVLTPFASEQPDGWNRVAIDTGLQEHVRDHPLGGLPLADYALAGVDEPLGGIIPGLVGATIVFALAWGGAQLLTRRPRAPRVRT